MDVDVDHASVKCDVAKGWVPPIPVKVAQLLSNSLFGSLLAGAQTHLRPTKIKILHHTVPLDFSDLKSLFHNVSQVFLGVT